jgi:hypothetical protein
MAEVDLGLELNLSSLEPEPESEPESTSPEEDIVEYARLHGICVDYTTEQLCIGDLKAPSNEDFERDLQNPSDASVTDAISGLTKERLSVNKDAALFLREVHSLQEAPVLGPLATDRRKWMLSLKQELPVLKSDYKLDLLNFGSAALPDLKNLQIPSEIVNEQNDEGLEWPANYFAYPAQCDAKAKAEKLAVSREVLIHLQDAIRDAFVPEDCERTKAESLKYKPVCGLADTCAHMLKDIEHRHQTCNTTTAPTYSTTFALHSIIARKSASICFRQQRLSHCRSASSAESNYGS